MNLPLRGWCSRIPVKNSNKINGKKDLEWVVFQHIPGLLDETDPWGGGVSAHAVKSAPPSIRGGWCSRMSIKNSNKINGRNDPGWVVFQHIPGLLDETDPWGGGVSAHAVKSAPPSIRGGWCSRMSIKNSNKINGRNDPGWVVFQHIPGLLDETDPWGGGVSAHAVKSAPPSIRGGWCSRMSIKNSNKINGRNDPGWVVFQHIPGLLDETDPWGGGVSAHAVRVQRRWGLRKRDLWGLTA